MVLGVQLVDALTLRSAGHGRPSRATISFHAALRRSVFADRPDFELRVGVSPCLLYRGTNASFLPVLSSETKWEVAFYGPPFYPSGHTTSAYELRFENFVNPVPGGRIGSEIMVHGSDARAMASVRGLLNIQSLNESSTHEKSPFNAPCHIWCYGPVCVSARDSARCLRGADHAIGGRANGERSAVFYVLNIQSLNESSTHEKGLTRGTRCALCAMCCGPRCGPAPAVFRLGGNRTRSAKKSGPRTG